MNKLILVSLNNIPKFNINITPNTTISIIKSTLKSFLEKNKLDINDQTIQFNINSKNQ